MAEKKKPAAKKPAAKKPVEKKPVEKKPELITIISRHRADLILPSGLIKPDAIGKVSKEDLALLEKLQIRFKIVEGL